MGVGGWVAGSNGNKANLSPAEAGAGLSLAKSNNLLFTSIYTYKLIHMHHDKLML